MPEAKRDYDRVELVWPGKRTEVERVRLPFQTIERINDVRRSTGGQAPLGEASSSTPGRVEGWRNRLIWGDNKYVLSSLQESLAGRVDLIYIDPPFDTGADFAFQVQVGEVDLEKLPGPVEELAYRDTWGQGSNSYLAMLYERLVLAKELLAATGTIYVQVGWQVSHYVRLLLEDVFGQRNHLNEVVWRRQSAHNDTRQGSQHYGRIHETIHCFVASRDQYTFNTVYEPYSEETIKSAYRNVEEGTGRRYSLGDITAPGRAKASKGNPQYEFLGVTRYWRFSEERMWELYREGRIVQTAPGRVPVQKRYLDEMPGVASQDLWLDIKPVTAQASERTDYETQKPEALLEKIISVSSNPGDLVMDFFAGSGTTPVVAEKLGRRWIATDIGRFAIHTTRKRLLSTPDCQPFEVQNLGRYERKHWQGARAGEAIGEYYSFILELYGARSFPGFVQLHGEKAGRMVHVGATDAPVTNTELRLAVEECVENGFPGLDVLGWEWEMGLNPAGKDELARHYGVSLRLYNIPREVMDKRAVDAGDVHFFELSVAEIKAHVDRREVALELSDFLPALDEYMSAKVQGKIDRWSDWIDYWSVDYEFDGETFVNQWQAYRTRKDPKLSLRSDPHIYVEPGNYTVVVKVIDIFGNDTTREITVEIE